CVARSAGYGRAGRGSWGPRRSFGRYAIASRSTDALLLKRGECQPPWSPGVNLLKPDDHMSGKDNFEGRPSTFPDQVYGRILSAIMTGVYPKGARLPSEKQLGETFGVSRPVVRVALSRLQRDGLIESRKGSGSFVLATPPEDLSSVADLAQVARYQRYQEFRLVVEGAAAALAAERRSEAA